MNRSTMTVAAAPRAWRLPALLLVLAVWLVYHTLSARLPVAQWRGALLSGTDASLPQLVVRYGWLPRLAIALIAGAALSLAGVVFQQVLRNPLAEPLTLGVSAGAYLALTIAAVTAPALAADMRFTVALAGAALAMLATMTMAWRKGFAAVSIVLAGMIVNLYCGALSVILTIVFERSLTAVFIWGGGSLVQNGWANVVWLLPRVLVCGIAAALLVRPLTLFSLDDGSASQLGMSLKWTRPLALGVAVTLSAFVASAVGVIGFIGLGGPVLARLMGARRVRDQLLWAPLVGALLLAIADQAVQSLPSVLGELLPTGAAVALCGGPLLLWMLRRVHIEAPRPASADSAPPRRALTVPALLLGGLLVAAVVVSLCFSMTLHGWQWSGAQQWSGVWFWRVPRLVASLGAGVMVALAGTILQRVTGNPMASPDLLGVSGGAMLGMLAAAVVAAAPSTPVLLAGSSAGALICLVTIVALGRRSGFAPEHVLLAGIAISAFSQAVVMLATASGGAYANLLRPLQYGSTYLIVPATAIAVGACTVVAVCVAYLAARWLEILPLGANVANALGVGAQRARLMLLVLAAILTAGATVVIGPMSFVGLMAPHLARLLGFARARSQMLVAALIGGLLMVLSDWLGRNLIFPQQMPAGVIATLLGGPYLMWLLRR
ncbi:Fe(3+)-hydroxamate ABC transporter permease FhuB [Paraburkholderia phenoliruptrix]|uniref:Iron complex transport system permease protein n=2 Tax=Paraburkholderia phenoliruptrix TaxID=252970 RepID=K0DKR0_9BURK|nr:Fe(3+)-hydroxamate ABC transporter permease FhuB [Paraburkholderia phenoliruptrix]AFT85337.1 iron complex transport system permease protein [Paraburkholderia phenoliruptrix BR3459a]MDR6421430.1 iron complex transport system permease protein [Paraburkholderia phenoliruptrix]CAB4047850.1 Iron(3+)-hydroxamate import system permease protein FhuB [Paraburkholderia phenoliruptrix]